MAMISVMLSELTRATALSSRLARTSQKSQRSHPFLPITVISIRLLSRHATLDNDGPIPRDAFVAVLVRSYSGLLIDSIAKCQIIFYRPPFMVELCKLRSSHLHELRCIGNNLSLFDADTRSRQARLRSRELRCAMGDCLAATY